jgi:hypothetical protein
LAYESPNVSVLTLEKLNRALVLLRGGTATEGAEITATMGTRIDLP